MATFDFDGAVTTLLRQSAGSKFRPPLLGSILRAQVVTDGVTVAGNLSVDGGTIKLDGNYPVGTE